MGRVPQLVRETLEAGRVRSEDIDLFLLHQATLKMNEQLREAVGVEESRMPILLEDYGNTVSATIPLLIDDLRQKGALRPGMQNLLVGFGVGWSWAACIWKETWSDR